MNHVTVEGVVVHVVHTCSRLPVVELHYTYMCTVVAQMGYPMYLMKV